VFLDLPGPRLQGLLNFPVCLRQEGCSGADVISASPDSMGNDIVGSREMYTWEGEVADMKSRAGLRLKFQNSGHLS
jgi:hypothetical protein